MASEQTRNGGTQRTNVSLFTPTPNANTTKGDKNMDIATLRRMGFDESYHVPFTKTYHVRCSQCQACSINGVPCHETGCGNQQHECRGCNALVGYRGAYCQDCQ